MEAGRVEGEATVFSPLVELSLGLAELKQRQSRIYLVFDSRSRGQPI